jgi:hypothetical protein
MTARAALLLLATVGCTATTYGRPGSPAAQDWLARHDRSEVEVDVAADRPADRAEVVIDARSPTDVRFLARDASVLSVDRVHKVVDVHHGLGALEGTAIGLGAGALFGLIYGGTRGLDQYEQSMDCTIVCNHTDAAKVGAIMFGVLGLVLGAATGAIVGTRDVLDLR